MGTDFYYSVLSVSIVLALFYYLYRKNRRDVAERLMQRQDTETEWSHANVNMELIDTLLEIVCEEFDFPLELRYRLSPQDTLIAVYRIEYPKTPMADCMELENITIKLQETCGAKIRKWDDPDKTLLELVRMMEEMK